MSARQIALAVTLCMRHGITPDRLAELIAERQARANKPAAPRPSPKQDAIAAALIEAGAAGIAQRAIALAYCCESIQGAQGQMRALAAKGRAFTAKKPGELLRWFSTQAFADAWAAAPINEACASSVRAATEPKRGAILELANSRGGAGITAADVAALLKIAGNAAHAHLNAMQGRTLWRARVRGHLMRYFPSAELANAWAAQQGAPVQLFKPAQPAKAPPVKLPPPPPAPALQQGDAVIPAGLVIQRVETPRGRFEVAANEITGGFSTSRPGINPLTGKAWA